MTTAISKLGETPRSADFTVNEAPPGTPPHVPAIPLRVAVKSPVTVRSTLFLDVAPPLLPDVPPEVVPPDVVPPEVVPPDVVPPDVVPPDVLSSDGLGSLEHAASARHASAAGAVR